MKQNPKSTRGCYCRWRKTTTSDARELRSAGAVPAALGGRAHRVAPREPGRDGRCGRRARPEGQPARQAVRSTCEPLTQILASKKCSHPSTRAAPATVCTWMLVCMLLWPQEVGSSLGVQAGRTASTFWKGLELRSAPTGWKLRLLRTHYQHGCAPRNEISAPFTSNKNAPAQSDTLFQKTRERRGTR